MEDNIWLYIIYAPVSLEILYVEAISQMTSSNFNSNSPDQITISHSVYDTQR